jgi:hypothetical protein
VDPRIINLRAGYDDELAAQVNYLLLRGVQRISLIRQADSFGTAGRNALLLALNSRGLTLHSESTFVRNTLVVQPAVASIASATPLPPEAIV